MNIITIGFEGPNRSGKGAQIELFSQYLANKEIPFLTVRGDGSRTADGSPGNAFSNWWNNINRDIHTRDGLYVWHEAASRLARELTIARKVSLPKSIALSGKNLGFLLVDRSILSRAVACMDEKEGNFLFSDLYPFAEGEFSLADICPNVILLFSAPKRALLSRLDDDNPKYEFRRKLIEKKWNWYGPALKLCPFITKEKVIKIDATSNILDIHKRILSYLSRFF